MSGAQLWQVINMNEIHTVAVDVWLLEKWKSILESVTNHSHIITGIPTAISTIVCVDNNSCFTTYFSTGFVLQYTIRTMYDFTVTTANPLMKCKSSVSVVDNIFHMTSSLYCKHYCYHMQNTIYIHEITKKRSVVWKLRLQALQMCLDDLY